jgi:2'-5' RNA ligase
MRASEGASVEGRERLRLFVALLLPDEAVRGLVRWQERELPAGGHVRRVGPANLHVTLAFLGSRPAAEAAPIAAAVREAAGTTGSIVLTPSRYRETRTVGMVVLDDEGGRAGLLAERVWDELERLGVYERERRPWLAHVTVLRFRGRPPRLAPPVPDLGPVSPSGLALYHSLLRPGGAQYGILESVVLGG